MKLNQRTIHHALRHHGDQGQPHTFSRKLPAALAEIYIASAGGLASRLERCVRVVFEQGGPRLASIKLALATLHSET